MATCGECLHYEACLDYCTEKVLSNRGVCEHYTPKSDYVKRECGEWKINSDGYYPYCSRCGKEPKNGVMSDFCPDCGADMRKEDNNA